MTYVIGHIKPDLDTVASAVAAQYLFDKAPCFGHEASTAVITQDINTETQYVFEKFGVTVPPVLLAESLNPEDTFVLMDHNEPSQRHEAITNESITEIIDHHLTNIQLPAIYITIKPWGSTCSIVWFLMKQNNITPPQNIAGIMLASILSDTVGFRAQTTTGNDKQFAQELASIAHVSDIDAFTLELFKAKSNTQGMSPPEIVSKDYKVFEMSNKKVLINQIETVEQSQVLDEKNSLVNAMNDIKKEQGVDYIFCAVSDVLEINTKMLFTTDEEGLILQKAFGQTIVNDNILDIGAKLSRKKEFAPQIQQAIESL